MKKSIRLLVRLIKNEDGATTVEYALLLALIVVFGIGAVLSLGTVQEALWIDTANTIQVIVP